MDDITKFLCILKRYKIVKIYHGKDGCRCGCNGQYLYSNDEGFADALVEAINCINDNGAVFGDGFVDSAKNGIVYTLYYE